MPLNTQDLDLNNITNSLLLKYDEKFNENYNKIVSINSSISNKEELINKENDVIINKDFNISILYYILLIIIIIILLFYLYIINKITLGQFIILSIISILVILLITYFRVYKKIVMYNLQKIFSNIKVDMVDFVEDIIPNISPYQCPSTCATEENDNDNVNAPNTGGNISTYLTPTLNIDPQTNVWKYGDIPESVFNNPNATSSNNYFYKNPKITDSRTSRDDSPQPLFNSTSHKSSTYYKCTNLDTQDNTINGLPNKESGQFSTIPCSYRPNFTQTNKYICTSDPNLLAQGTDILTICDDVSQL